MNPFNTTLLIEKVLLLFQTTVLIIGVFSTYY